MDYQLNDRVFEKFPQLYTSRLFLRAFEEEDSRDLFLLRTNEKAIEFNRFLVQPTLFSNILWYGIAETDDTYVVAEYSLLDTGNRFLNFSNSLQGYAKFSLSLIFKYGFRCRRLLQMEESEFL